VSREYDFTVEILGDVSPARYAEFKQSIAEVFDPISEGWQTSESGKPEFFMGSMKTYYGDEISLRGFLRAASLKCWATILKLSWGVMDDRTGYIFMRDGEVLREHVEGECDWEEDLGCSGPPDHSILDDES
jgi:hypothetical protein